MFGRRSQLPPASSPVLQLMQEQTCSMKSYYCCLRDFCSRRAWGVLLSAKDLDFLQPYTQSRAPYLPHGSFDEGFLPGSCLFLRIGGKEEVILGLLTRNERKTTIYAIRVVKGERNLSFEKQATDTFESLKPLGRCSCGLLPQIGAGRRSDARSRRRDRPFARVS
jgi:hypothetical protein